MSRFGYATCVRCGKSRPTHWMVAGECEECIAAAAKPAEEPGPATDFTALTEEGKRAWGHETLCLDNAADHPAQHIAAQVSREERARETHDIPVIHGKINLSAKTLERIEKGHAAYFGASFPIAAPGEVGATITNLIDDLPEEAAFRLDIDLHQPSGYTREQRKPFAQQFAGHIDRAMELALTTGTGMLEVRAVDPNEVHVAPPVEHQMRRASDHYAHQAALARAANALQSILACITTNTKNGKTTHWYPNNLESEALSFLIQHRTTLLRAMGVTNAT